MRLIIAEKPSLARAIAAAMPGNSRQAGHHLQCSNGDVVAWCAGHILETAPPEDYTAGLKHWSLETLPIIPDHWKHRVSRPELVDSLGMLLARATRVVHAGDPDREGQLLVDEVLLHLGWKGPTDRLLVTDLSPPAVRRALDALEPNERYRPLFEAALARQRADWLYGMNLTRLYTLRAGLAGYRGVLSVGRVQTPLLGLIVRRDREIEAFVSKPFYGVEATLRTAEGSEFKAHWAVGKESQFTDDDGRLLDRRIAEAVAQRTAGQPAVVATHEQKRETEAPPLPYSLADLQVDAGRKLALSAAQVLELAQRLYELQLLTYPRSDCSHLPEEHWGQARGVLRAIAAASPGLAEACAAADPSRRSKAWNDAKVTAHHAIIPTVGEPSSLSEPERALYELVALRYVQQFLPPFEYLRTKVALTVAGEAFEARGRQVLVLGWKTFERQSGEHEEASDEEQDTSTLPPLRSGQALLCRSTRVVENRTQPPKPFTDATLIQAMCNVAKYVSDARAKKLLQDADGIGTPATRASIIERLFERRFIERRKKQIRSTPLGRALIAALPTVATTPDQTAVWESAMRRIHHRELGLDRFLTVITEQLSELVRRGKAQGPLSVPAGAAQPPPRAKARNPVKLPRRRGKASGRVSRARSAAPGRSERDT